MYTTQSSPLGWVLVGAVIELCPPSHCAAPCLHLCGAEGGRTETWGLPGLCFPLLEPPHLQLTASEPHHNSSRFISICLAPHPQILCWWLRFTQAVLVLAEELALCSGCCGDLSRKRHRNNWPCYQHSGAVKKHFQAEPKLTPARILFHIIYILYISYRLHNIYAPIYYAMLHYI